MFLRRVRRAHFGVISEMLSPLGLPLFALLLLRSRLHYRWRKQVTWKGRTYSQISRTDICDQKELTNRV